GSRTTRRLGRLRRSRTGYGTTGTMQAGAETTRTTTTGVVDGVAEDTIAADSTPTTAATITITTVTTGIKAGGDTTKAKVRAMRRVSPVLQ
ncbi:hypothetical protein EV176_007524, partial [Coemansia sp. RSA 451]